MSYQSIPIAPDRQAAQTIAQHVLACIPSDVAARNMCQRVVVVLPSAHVLSDVRRAFTEQWLQSAEKATGGIAPVIWISVQELQQQWMQTEGVSTSTAAVASVWSVYEALSEQEQLRKIFGEDPQTWLQAAAEMIDLAQELANADLLSEQRWQSTFYLTPQQGHTWLSHEAQLLLSVAKALEAQQQLGVRAKAAEWIQKLTGPLVWVEDAQCPVWTQAMFTEVSATQEVRHLNCGHAYFWQNHPWREYWQDMCLASDALPGGNDTIRWSDPAMAYIEQDNFENTALMAAQTIYAFLQEQPQASVALVALDRVLARRVRALLERAHILVDDKTGWGLSTTASATAIMRLLEALVHNEISPLLDWLRSPFVSWDRLLEDSSIQQDDSLQVLPTREGLLATMEAARIQGQWIDVIEHLGTIPAVKSCPSLHRALMQIAQTSATGTVSFDQLHHLLQLFQVPAQLLQDTAGSQVLAAWFQMAELFEGQKRSVSTWRAAFHYELEAQRYRPNNITSPVVMVSLTATRLRQFDGVFLLGADAQHLPSAQQQALFFNDRVRAELGLLTQKDRQAEVMRDLARLIFFSQATFVIWQSMEETRPRSISPWLMQIQSSLPSPLRRSVRLPMVAVPPESLLLPDQLLNGQIQVTIPVWVQLPTVISVTQSEWLLQCPYRFYLHSILKIQMNNLMVSHEPQRRDVGLILHAVLWDLHQAYPNPDTWPSNEELWKFWDDAIQKHIASIVGTYPLAFLYALELEQAGRMYIPSARLELANFYIGEQSVSLPVLTEPNAVTLRGRLDRVDYAPATGWHLIDYKWGSTTRSQGLARTSIQLSLYEMMWRHHKNIPDTEPVSSSFWAINRADSVKVPVHEEQNTHDILDELQSTLLKLSQRALFSNVPDLDHCTYCSYSGICRKSRMVGG